MEVWFTRKVFRNSWYSTQIDSKIFRKIFLQFKLVDKTPQNPHLTWPFPAPITLLQFTEVALMCWLKFYWLYTTQIPRL